MDRHKSTGTDPRGGGRDIVVIGASAGGIDAVRQLLRPLPHDFPAAVFLVMHSPPRANSLISVLRREVNFPLDWATDGQRFEPGRLYVGFPDHHLLIERGRVRLERSPKQTHFRPSIDALFRSAALAYGRRVVGVLLSGGLNDGTVGMWDIKKRGGVTIVQDPAETQHPNMVQNALANVPIDHCLRAEEAAQVLIELAAREPALVPFDRPAAAKVLIVEDERIVAKNLERRLGALGHEVTGSVASGEAAIEAAAQRRPDVVLMDIRLSGSLSGTDAARLLWERFQVPVVYVTAYADADTVRDLKATEAYGYVLKPFEPEEIDVAIQLALERRDRETRET